VCHFPCVGVSVVAEFPPPFAGRAFLGSLSPLSCGSALQDQVWVIWRTAHEYREYLRPSENWLRGRQAARNELTNGG